MEESTKFKKGIIKTDSHTGPQRIGYQYLISLADLHISDLNQNCIFHQFLYATSTLYGFLFVPILLSSGFSLHICKRR